jgi:hypothetical protein
MKKAVSALPLALLNGSKIVLNFNSFEEGAD